MDTNTSKSMSEQDLNLKRFIALIAALISSVAAFSRTQTARSSQVAKLQQRLEEQESAISASFATQARAAAALQNAQEEFRRAEERMAVVERNFRLYERELKGARGARSAVDEDLRRAEAERQQVQEQRNQTELRVRTANEERARADADARTARLEHEHAVHSRLHAELAAHDARSAQAAAEHRWRDGIRPVVWPTLAELHAAKERLSYTEGLIHFAIAGVAGSGKSSLVNALRGLRNSDEGAAPTGVIETTDTTARFPDPDPTRPFVWYDVPGAGTLSVPDWQYFTDQGLYIFDCIIVLFDTRLTATDIAILRNCARFDIPTYVVRSKALQHIRNLAADMPDDDDGDDGDDSASETSTVALERARMMYVRDTRLTVSQNLEAAGLPDQREYVVDKDTLVRAVKGRPVKEAVDEYDLLKDLLAKVNRRQVSEAEGNL